MSLAEWIEKAEILFVGWDRREPQIVAFARVAGAGLREAGEMASFTLGTDFTGASRRPSYVNGRLLSGGRPVHRPADTWPTRDRWIGEAAGSGVVDGLTVTARRRRSPWHPASASTAAGEPTVLHQNATLPLAVPLAEASTDRPGEVRLLRAPATGRHRRSSPPAATC